MQTDAVCEVLLAKGAEVDALGEGCYTALMRASRHGQLALCKLLLNHGARAELSMSGLTNLIAAAERGYSLELP